MLGWLGILLGLLLGLWAISRLARMAARLYPFWWTATYQSRYPWPLPWIELANQFLCREWHRLADPEPGDRQLPPTGPAIVVALHRCSLDPFLIHAYAHRRIHFLVTNEFERVPLVGHFLRAVGCVPVNRKEADIASVRATMRLLHEGRVVGIFPEGGINENNQPVRIRPGTATLALRTGVSVIPTGLLGIRPSGSVFWGMLWPQRVRVRFGPPVDLSDLTAGGGRVGPQQVELATQRIMDAVRAVR